MNIVLGRGKKRQVIELPCGSLVAQFAKQDPDNYRSYLEQVKQLLVVA